MIVTFQNIALRDTITDRTVIHENCNTNKNNQEKFPAKKKHFKFSTRLTQLAPAQLQQKL